MASFRSKQPGKAFWTTCFLISAPVRLIYMGLYFLPQSLRQNSTWSYRQAFGNAAIRMWLEFISTIEIIPPMSLEPGSDKECWTIMKPASQDFYRHKLDDPEIRPATIGGMWYPTPYDPKKHQNKHVILHFHGGAYVIGGCRPSDHASWGATNLSTKLSAIVLMPQYRLASHPNINGRFPAAFQDALTSYKHLLDLGIPASNIILSGASAGGNLVLALLRYLSELEDDDLFPLPGAALLWSPWVDLSSDCQIFNIDRKGKSDFVPPKLLEWGLRAFKPSSLELTDPYLSPLHSPFFVKVPIFVQCGSTEGFCSDVRTFTERMKAVSGNVIEMMEAENAPHDILLLGETLGWTEETFGAMDAANAFLIENLA